MVAQLDRHYVSTRPWKVWSRLLAYTLFEGRPLTTRGRWINPVVTAFLRGVQALPGLRDMAGPIFIIGTGRSGTTIFGKLLSMHRDVAFLNEPKLLWHLVHPGEDVIGSYADAPGRFVLGADDATDARARALRRAYGALGRLGLASRVVDKYPELIFRVPFVRAMFPDARFLFLIRRGWDACTSIASWSDRHGRGEPGAKEDWWGLDDRKWEILVEELVPGDPDLGPHAGALAETTCHTTRAVVEWIVTMRAGLAARAADPDAIVTVRYEELAGEPARVLAEVLEACDLPPDPILVRYAGEVMSPPPPRERFDLPGWLEEPFRAVHGALGYGDDA